jgi:outer membrane protein TolC
VPDYNVGLELDVKASPLMARPSFGLSLPIWRDKIAATIAAAQAAKAAGEARLEAEQIMLAVDLAERTFMLREATRNVKLFEEALLPKAQQSIDVARSAYLTGRIDFFNLLDASRTLLDFELKRIDAKTQRELALAELSYVIAGIPISGVPSGVTTRR